MGQRCEPTDTPVGAVNDEERPMPDAVLDEVTGSRHCLLPTDHLPGSGPQPFELCGEVRRRVYR